MKNPVFAAFMIGFVPGCANWPTDGKGGFAEHEVLQDRYATTEIANLKLSQLHRDWQLQDLRLQIMKLNRASECYPALINQAEQQDNRSLRTIHSELFSDGEVEIIKFKSILDAVDARIRDLTREVECGYRNDKHEDITIESTQSMDEDDKFAEMLELLNTTFQFSTNSSELLPQYKDYLMHTARVLKDYPEINLQIIGHADERGNSIINEKLSYSRAKKVSDLLIASGVDSQRIIMLSHSHDRPLLKGNSEYDLLANRRVEIRLEKKLENFKISNNIVNDAFNTNKDSNTD